MAGETAKTVAACLRISPWSRTSHVVSWLTPSGPIATMVKGAVRPKSAFLGQYDLNYTCEIVYYTRSRGEIHALKECAPLKTRDALRGDFRKLAAADRFRDVALRLAPPGEESERWLRLLEDSLDRLEGEPRDGLLRAFLEYEIAALDLAGLAPEIEASEGSFSLRGERRMPLSPEVAAFMKDPSVPADRKILLDAARVIGVFYAFHVDIGAETRRAAIGLVCKKEEKGKQ